jgi:hypothetical protein
MIPTAYRPLAGLLLALALVGGGFYAGQDWATTKAEAAHAAQLEAQIAATDAEHRRADALTRQLASAEGRVVIRTVEVIKHVPEVTTGRLCLGSDAVGLLHPSTDWGPYQTPGQPAAESPPAAAASDRDVVLWAAEAQQRYATCAARLNTLVDWHTGAD